MDLPLIRTDGNTFLRGPTLSPARFAGLPVLARESKTDVTRLVERDCDLGNCLYFYAGHACPGFGDVVLVYNATMADREGSGSATPFDTGGLHAGFVRLNFPLGIGTVVEGVIYACSWVTCRWQGKRSDAEARTDRLAWYCRLHAVGLRRWRRKAATYITRHFGSAAGYLRGARPTVDDLTGRLHHPENERRAWTWEVRLHRDHPMTDSLRRIWMSEDYYEGVRQVLLSTPGSYAECRALLRAGIVEKAPFGASPHLNAEAEAATWI